MLNNFFLNMKNDDNYTLLLLCIFCSFVPCLKVDYGYFKFNFSHSLFFSFLSIFLILEKCKILSNLV